VRADRVPAKSDRRRATPEAVDARGKEKKARKSRRRVKHGDNQRAS